jgi:uncharacterized protein (TIGR01777 family)
MRVTIVGATGFIGRPLAAALRARGDEVVEASLRDPHQAARRCAGSDVVVNLAGAPVSVRWTPTAKRAMWFSRVDAPRAMLDTLVEQPARPSAYVSASAIGYYGTSETATFAEDSPPGDDELARLCIAWEAQADRAADFGMRVAKVRTGLVLGLGGGVLGKLAPLYRLGLGGPIASGRQWYSWIHLADQLGIYLHAIDGAAGVFDATAPHPVTNAEFNRSLGRAVHRPAIFPVPSLAAAALLGEGAYVITQGQRVLPQQTVASGYVFRFPELDAALADLFTSVPAG